MVKTFNAKSAPAALGPYSHGVIHSDVIYLSGQLGLDPGSGELAPGGLEAQCRRIFTNIQNILEEVGSDLGQVIQARIYMMDLTDFALVNEIYGEFLGETKPARSTVQVAGLPKGALIEIEVTAIIQNYSN